MFLLDRNVNMSKSEEIEPNAGSDADCGTLTSFKLEISKNRAKYRRIEEGLLSDTEKEKLNQRRERNKAAAARCRNRRRETISRLEKEASDWDEKVQELKNDIEKLTKQRDQLEFLLEVHIATCSLINHPLPSQRLDELLSQQQESKSAAVVVPPRAASANHVLTPTSSSLPPLSEVVKSDNAKLGSEESAGAAASGKVVQTSHLSESTLKLLILSTSDASTRNGDLIVPTALVTAAAPTLPAVKPSSLNLNLANSTIDVTKQRQDEKSSENSCKLRSPSSGDSSSGKALSKNFTLPLIVTPGTPQADINGGGGETPLLGANLLLDNVSKFTPSTPLFCASVTNGVIGAGGGGGIGCNSSATANNLLGLSGAATSLMNHLKGFSTTWTPIFSSAVSANGLASALPGVSSTIPDSLFTPMLDVKPEPASPPLGSNSLESNSVATADSAD
ncbi:uncharacterized protein LOC142352190 [Convolutriloba macropyga]|uniref:uncharacterized protein LOC142352190 n=1 Tax=Convolutriloba macropyga TaxID=536237 RepID=UPI003F523125